MHRENVGGHCPECKEYYASRSGLLQHIETNLCAGGLKRRDIHRHILEELQEESTLRAQEAKERESSVGNTTPANSVSHLTSDNVDDDTQSVMSMTSSVARARAIAVVDLDRLAELNIEEINNEPIEIKKEWYDRQRKLWCCPHPKCR